MPFTVPRLLANLFWMTSLCCGSAQADDWMRNPDITWVAEYTASFCLDPETETDNFSALNSLALIHFQNPVVENGLYGRLIYTPRYLSESMLGYLKSKNCKAYRDSLFLERLSPAQIKGMITRYDTLAVEPAEADDTDYVIVAQVLSTEQIKRFRARLICAYNAEKRQFDTRLLAYAPVLNIYDNEGNILGDSALLWFEADKLPRRGLDVQQFNYILQTRMRDNAPLLTDFKTLKGSLDLKALVRAELAHPSHPLLNYENYQGIAPATLSAQLVGADTLIEYLPKTYAENLPETYAEQITVRPWNRVEQIERIRFIHNWYYDERSHRLYARLVGIAPLAAMRGEDGDFRYNKPLYYQMYR